MEELETKLTQGPCGERLITKIILEMKEYKKFHEDSEGIDGLNNAVEMGEKLLSYDYFAESNKISDEFYKAKGDPVKKVAEWNNMYAKELYKKKSDYREFFKLIIDNIEDWC